MLRTTALLALALAVTGCDGFSDFVDDPVGDFALKIAVRDAEVPLGAGVTVDVTPERPTVSRAPLDADFDVQLVDEVRDLRIRPQDIRFTPAPGRVAARGGSDATGTLSANVGILFHGTYVPALSGTVTIVDGVVTAVEFSAFHLLQGMSLEQIEHIIGVVDPSMSADDAAALIAEAFTNATDPSTEFVIAIETTGNLSGSITLDQIQYDGVVTP